MSWWRETAQAVAEAGRSNPGMSADRLAEEARRIHANRTSSPAASTTVTAGNYHNYSYQPANAAREAKAASIVAGVAHDSFRLQPVGLPSNVLAPIVSYTDQYYKKVDQEEAVGLFRSLPSWQQQAWANAAQALGGGPRTAESTYANYLEISGYLSAKGINKDPLDLLLEDTQTGYMPPNLFDRSLDLSSSSGSSSYSSYGGGGYGGGGGGGGGSVSLTNPTSARGLLMQTMQSVLGRNPTNDEYRTFLQVLNEAEMANPNTASFEDGMAVGSGGVDPGVLALEFAQDQEDFTERQGDRYFRTFMQALAGGV